MSPRWIATAFAVATVAVVQIPQQPARAQLLDKLNGAMGSQGLNGQRPGGQLGGAGTPHTEGPLGALGSGVPSVSATSTSNTAGVLQYCMQNNYLSGGSASSIENSLVGKVKGNGHIQNNSDYEAGRTGTLRASNGRTFSLAPQGNQGSQGSEGLRAKVTQKVCDQVLAHAKSLL